MQIGWMKKISETEVMNKTGPMSVGCFGASPVASDPLKFTLRALFHLVYCRKSILSAKPRDWCHHIYTNNPCFSISAQHVTCQVWLSVSIGQHEGEKVPVVTFRVRQEVFWVENKPNPKPFCALKMMAMICVFISVKHKKA